MLSLQKNVPNYFLMIPSPHFLCFPFLQHLLSRIWIFWIFPEILCFLHCLHTILYCLTWRNFLSPTFWLFVFLHFHSHPNWQRTWLLFLNVCIYVYTYTHVHIPDVISACSICFWFLWNINYSSCVVFWVFFFIKMKSLFPLCLSFLVSFDLCICVSVAFQVFAN